MLFNHVKNLHINSKKNKIQILKIINNKLILLIASYTIFFFYNYYEHTVDLFFLSSMCVTKQKYVNILCY